MDDRATRPADKAVGDLVHEHAGEDHDQPRDPTQRPGPSGRGTGKCEQRHEQEERDVDTDLDTRDGSDAERVRDHMSVVSDRGSSDRGHVPTLIDWWAREQ